MIDLIELEKIIRKVGVPAGSSGSSKKPVYEVRCQECGRAIRSDDISEVEYVQARRKKGQIHSVEDGGGGFPVVDGG